MKAFKKFEVTLELTNNIGFKATVVREVYALSKRSARSLVKGLFPQNEVKALKILKIKEERK